MARIVKEYDERNAEFLEVARRLFYTKGYEQTSVQEIIRTVGVAKGTFYHYFASKAALLDELVEHLLAQALTALQPMVADPTLDAREKFERFFAGISNWKTANRELLLAAMRVLYQDENVLLRTKMQTEATTLVAPLLAEIIYQGIEEGVFDMAEPEEAAEILVRMGQGLSDAIVPLFLTDDYEAEAIERIERKIHAYTRSVERVLGAGEGSIHLFDPNLLKVWLPEKK